MIARLHALNSSVRRALLAGSIALGVALLVVSHRAETAADEVSQSYQTIDEINAVRLNFLRTSYWLTSYLQTERPESLTRMRHVSRAAEAAAARVIDMTRGDRSAHTLARLVQSELKDSLQQYLDIGNIGEREGAEAARGLMAERASIDPSVGLRGLLDGVEKAERERLDRRRHEAASEFVLLRVAAVAAVALLLTLFAWAKWRSRQLYQAATQDLQRLSEGAMSDPLTGLANRRHLEARSLELLASPPSQGQPALILLDLDRFKPINDTHGHDAGDEVLVAIGRRLQACCRAGDLAARIGGDEFAVLLQAVGSREDAETLALRLGAAVQQPVTLGSGVTVRVTTSCGVALFGHDGLSWKEILAVADRGLYRRKRRSRPVQGPDDAGDRERGGDRSAAAVAPGPVREDVT